VVGRDDSKMLSLKASSQKDDDDKAVEGLRMLCME
jgi:hypothetical protein